MPKTVAAPRPFWIAWVFMVFLYYTTFVAALYLIPAQSHPHIDLSQCPSRLSPQQAPLFALDKYYKQFSRTGRRNNGTILHEELM